MAEIIEKVTLRLEAGMHVSFELDPDTGLVRVIREPAKATFEMSVENLLEICHHIIDAWDH